MEKDTNTRETRSCYACGHERPANAVRPFGWSGSQIKSWICTGCDEVPELVHPAPANPRAELAVAQ